MEWKDITSPAEFWSQVILLVMVRAGFGVMDDEIRQQHLAWVTDEEFEAGMRYGCEHGDLMPLDGDAPLALDGDETDD